MRFVDTNVLIYAVSTAPEDEAKTRKALSLLDASDLALSVQVLQEFYVQATRATRPGALTHDEAVLFTISLTRFRIQEMTIDVMLSAFEMRERLQLSYWDAAILAAAQACRCESVLSEDFNAGQDYDGVQVIDPFGEK